MSEPLRLVDTKVWFLELAELRPARTAGRVERVDVPLGALNRWFYEEVGRDFDWTDKAGWPREQWQAWAEHVETWVLYDRGTPAGYAELGDRGIEIEIETFGLLEPFRGRGLGGALLTRAAERALELAGDRGKVTVNTCELDGPYALDHYRARGFEIVREELQQRPSRRKR